MKKFLLSIFCCLMAVFAVQAQTEPIYTLVPQAGSNNAYAGNCDIEIDGIKWNLTGNSTMIPWRMGGKNLNNVDRTLYSKTPMNGEVNKVVLSVGTSSLTVNSSKLLVADNADFTNAVETSFETTASTDIEIPVSAASGSYYKFVFNVTVSGSSNKYIQISKVEFYGAAGEEGGTTEPDNGEGEGGNDNENDEETVEYTAIEFIEAGKEATIKGTVVATNARSFLVEDETGIILVYLATTPEVNVGEEVTVSGTVTEYGGMPQFPQSSIIAKTGVTNEVVYPEATVMDGAAMDAFLSSPEINYVEYTGTLNISGNYYNVAIEGAATAVGSIQYPASGFVTATSGAVVKVTGYTIGVSSKKYVNTMAITVETVEDAPEAEEPETPVETKEYTVAEALAAYVDGKQIPAIVTGYIVGAMNSTGYVAEFGTTTVNTNILLSDNVDETDEANCIIVELPKGEIREKLNLVDNPDNYKKKLRITGSIEKYFRVAGLKNPTVYELITETTGIKNMDVVTENGVIFDITGRKVENMTVPGIYIVNGKKVLVK